MMAGVKHYSIWWGAKSVSVSSNLWPTRTASASSAVKPQVRDVIKRVIQKKTASKYILQTWKVPATILLFNIGEEAVFSKGLIIHGL